MALAQRAGLGDLIAGLVRPGGDCGVNAHLKVPCLVAGMAAGADSIDDMGLLRHGAMPALFGGVRAPSTLGSHLRCYTWGNVSQLEKAGREFLVNLAGRAPLLPGAGTLAFIDIDSMQKRVYGHNKQGARFGHTKIQGKSLLVRGLNALTATMSTPLSAPVLAATRLRGGNAASARGAASLAARARLIVRRVRDLNKQAAGGQGELFPVWRYHAVFTDSPFVLVQAEGQHRDHAIVEQVFADVTSGPLAHMPSGVFTANAAWLSIAAMAHNLVRAAGALASLPFARARAATIRRDLIAVAARTARHGRGHLTLHLPAGWHREHEWLTLLAAANSPPAAAA